MVVFPLENILPSVKCKFYLVLLLYILEPIILARCTIHFMMYVDRIIYHTLIDVYQSTSCHAPITSLSIFAVRLSHDQYFVNGMNGVPGDTI